MCSQACRDFLALAQAHSKRWQKALQAEREQRVRLEEALEQLAKQHNHLERAFRGAAQANANVDNKGRFDPGVSLSFLFFHHLFTFLYFFLSVTKVADVIDQLVKLFCLFFHKLNFNPFEHFRLER